MTTHPEHWTACSVVERSAEIVRRLLAADEKEAALRVAKERADSVVWVADDGNAEVEYPDAGSAHEAAQTYVDDGDWGDDDSSFAVTIYTWQRYYVGGEHVDRERSSSLIVVHPEEPACEATQDGEHRWGDPHELVGGCKESPGVWGGRGCAIDCVDVCLCCGLGRRSGGPSQGFEQEHDHSYVRYGGEDSVGLDVLAAYHDGDEPDGLRAASPLAAEMRRRALPSLINTLETWACVEQDEARGLLVLRDVAEGDDDECRAAIGDGYTCSWWIEHRDNDGSRYYLSGRVPCEGEQLVLLVEVAL